MFLSSNQDFQLLELLRMYYYSLLGHVSLLHPETRLVKSLWKGYSYNPGYPSIFGHL